MFFMVNDFGFDLPFDPRSLSNFGCCWGVGGEGGDVGWYNVMIKL
jgi:hypothetical protein